MGKHSVAEAKNRLSELIDRALEGEDVVITRHGTPVVELRPTAPALRNVSREALEWLDTHRVNPTKVGDAAKLVREMRDEDEH